MYKEIFELDEMARAIDENYSSITDFPIEPPFGTGFPVAILDSPAMKISIMGIGFLDTNAALAEAFTAKETIEAGRFAKYAAYMKIAENLEATVAMIDSEVAALKAEDVSEFQTLKRVKQFFTNFKPAVERYRDRSEKGFDEIFYRNLGQRIRQVRSQQGLTIEEFASMIFNSRANVGRYELGIRVPSPATLYQISKVFGVSVDWLLGVEVVTGGSDRNADN